MRTNAADSRLVHHMFQATDFGGAITLLLFGADGQLVYSANAANVCMPSAARLGRVGIHAACGVVNVAGDWTLRLRLNESGSDSATIGFGIAALPGTKTAGQWSSDVIIQAGETYHIEADGPSRNIILARVVMTWEVL